MKTKSKSALDAFAGDDPKRLEMVARYRAGREIAKILIKYRLHTVMAEKFAELGLSEEAAALQLGFTACEGLQTIQSPEGLEMIFQDDECTARLVSNFKDFPGL